MHKILSLGLLAAIASPAFAQSTFIGFNYNTGVGATSRGALSVGAGDVLNRIDGREYGGWGLGNAGFRTITSINFNIQDQDALLTPNEAYDIVAYPEDPLNPHYPDPTQRQVIVTGLTFPTSTAAITAYNITATPAVPAQVPIQGNGDIFIGFALPTATGWANDGLSIHIILGYQPSAAFTVWDNPGFGQQPVTPTTAATSHGLSCNNGVPPYTYNGTRQLYFDIAHSTSAGVVLGITNQTNYLPSNNPPPAGYGPAPGTAGMMSGVSPDVSGYDPLRVDDVTMEYYRAGAGAAPLAFFFLSIGGIVPAAAELPMSLFTPGDGVVCLNLVSAMSLGLANGTATDEAWYTLSFGAGRSSLQGLPVGQQAIELDLTTFQAHASPCGKQVY